MFSSPLPLDARVRPYIAAEYVGVSRQLLYSWCKAGKLKPDDDGLIILDDALKVERDTRRSPRSRRAA